MVSAIITLCLDILHRPRIESEFAEHKKLVDQAVALLGRYDDSTLAVRDVRVLSSLLERATKQQQPSRRHARHDNKNTLTAAVPALGHWRISRTSMQCGLSGNPIVRTAILSRLSHQ